MQRAIQRVEPYSRKGMATSQKVTPIFGTCFTMFSFVGDNQHLVDHRLQWRYISLLLVELHSHAFALVVKQTKCPLCDFVPLTITSTVITEHLKFAYDERSRIVSWMVPGKTDRVQVQFCLEDEFLTFMACILHVRRMQPTPPKDWTPQLECCVEGFGRLLWEVAAPSFNIVALRAGQPPTEDFAPDATCLCFVDTDTDMGSEASGESEETAGK
ncbi:hypothetical protein LXA43DRAFT_1101842 [Ganoderma leucocontextum]|nr:hypothetical protein LXA43DRAFT_1101842 [Ganoderma leucocontextum]